MYTKQERERYNEHRERACQRLGITKNQYNWLRRKGNELHKIYEDNCNGKVYINYDGVYENLTNRLYTEINKYIEKVSSFSKPLFVYFQTDPRGATIYLDIKEILENNYTQAVCIY